ncbi:hypothetical protein ACIRD3_04070 [Kitasatospora sp. NPDC093550]|uniref:hypothetical protein n=1 Tax=Kitasatospora sp. NPDC093550 TaxID=3364089 RepID=UPI00380849F8
MPGPQGNGGEHEWPTVVYRGGAQGRQILRVNLPEGADAAVVGTILTRHGIAYLNVADIPGEEPAAQVELVGGDDVADRAVVALRADLAGRGDAAD